MKKCSKCKIEKPESEFPIRSRNSKPISRCRECQRQYSKLYMRYLDPEKKKTWKRNTYQKSGVLRRYNITRDNLDKLIETADGFCQICEFKMGVVHIDHDRNTGKVRGLLCKQCNAALGLFMDSPHLLRAAADYIERCD